MTDARPAAPRWPTAEAAYLLLLTLLYFGPVDLQRTHGELPEAPALLLPFFLLALPGLSAARLTWRAVRAASWPRAAFSAVCAAVPAALAIFWALIVRGLGSTGYGFAAGLALAGILPAALLIFPREIWRLLARRSSVGG